LQISRIETLTHDDYPHILHVRLHTTDGLVGLGESFHHPEALAQYIHTVIAPDLLGHDACNVAGAWLKMGAFTDGRQPFAGTISVESSATSAVDIALWDLRAKVLGLPLHDALGGAVRDGIRVYNTAAETGHLPPPGTPAHRRSEFEDWGIGGPQSDEFDDWTASIERPGELARELVAAGITAMKIYPFHRLIGETRGLYITRRQLQENVEIFRDVRNAVGDDIDIAADLGFCWAQAPALQIAAALEEFGLMWIEDLVRTSAIDALANIARVVRTPLAGFDYFAGLPAYMKAIESGALAIARLDLQWVGGVSEATRIAGYADAKGLGVVLHDCTGPVQWATSLHCSVHFRNAVIQESVRAYYRIVYQSMIKAVPEVRDGRAFPLQGAGHGAELLDAYVDGARRVESTIRNGAFATEVLAGEHRLVRA